MQQIDSFFAWLSATLWGWPMIILLVGTHIFLTFRLRIPQRKLFTGFRLSVAHEPGAKGDVSLDIIWSFADSMNALMAIPNLIALLLLSNVAARETRKYLWDNRLDERAEEA